MEDNIQYKCMGCNQDYPFCDCGREDYQNGSDGL